MLSKFADYKPKLRNPGRRQVPTFQTVTDRWWESKSRELAPGSLKSYVPCVARAVDVFGGYRILILDNKKTPALPGSKLAGRGGKFYAVTFK